MKFIHTADWHLGKLFYGGYLTEEQEWILKEQFIPLVDEEKPDVILLAGDVYDRSVPPAEAVDLFNEIEKLVQEIEDNEASNGSDILNNKFSQNFEKNIKSFVSYSYYDDGSINSKTEYDFDKKSITMLTYSEGKILSETIAKYKGSIQDENMDIDFYESLSKTYTKMKVKKVETGQEVRTFYPSGKLQSVGVYKDNILNGIYKEYDEAGNLIKEFKNDDFIGE